jgi:hypothetical protein
MEKIMLISNPNTVNFKELKRKRPVSYAVYGLQKQLENSGMTLNFINQDKNRVYFTIKIILINIQLQYLNIRMKIY